MYALLKVTYDEWRHQERVFTSEDKDDVICVYLEDFISMPLYEYEKDGYLSERLDELEQPHYWLREFKE